MEINLNKKNLEKYFSDPLWYLNDLMEQKYLFSGYEGLSKEEKMAKSDQKIKFIAPYIKPVTLVTGWSLVSGML